MAASSLVTNTTGSYFLAIDQNGNGEIEVSEAQLITAINVSNANISSLSGIENFSNLFNINFDDNNVPSISAVGLNNLKQMQCVNNHMTSYSFLNNFLNLKYFNAGNDLVTSISFGSLPNLLKFAVRDNPNLQSINFNGLTGLKTLGLNSCPINNINFLPLVNLENLSLNNSQISNLNLTQIPTLKSLECNNNLLTTLNFTENPNLEKVDCSFNQLTTLDFRNNFLFYGLACRNNNLNSIYLKNGTKQLYDNQPFPSQIYDNWNNNPNLNYICADNNEITDIQTNLMGSYNLNTINFDSNCLLSTIKNDLSNISIAPNPINDIMSIDLTNNNEVFLNFVIIDLLGKIVFEKNLRPFEKNQINIAHLNKGIYLVRVYNDKKSINVKLIKN